MAALGLLCCTRAFSSCGEWGLLFVAVRGLLIAVASLCCRARALGTRASVVVAHGLQSTGSVVVVHGLSCSTACETFLYQGLNPCPLHWQADSQPLCHQGSPQKMDFLVETDCCLLILYLLCPCARDFPSLYQISQHH